MLQKLIFPFTLNTSFPLHVHPLFFSSPLDLTPGGKCTPWQQSSICSSPSLRRAGDPVVMLTPRVNEFLCRLFPFHSVVNSGALSRASWISPEVTQQLFNLMYVCVKPAIKSLSPSHVHAFMTSSGYDRYFSMHVQDLHSAGGSVTSSFSSIFAPRICQVHGNKRGL